MSEDWGIWGPTIIGVESRSDAVEFRQAVAETGAFGRRCLSIAPSFAHMPSPLPRCSSTVLLSLASHRDGGLRLFGTSSAFTLRFSRLARRSLILWPARSLIAFSATFCTEGLRPCSSCPLRTLRLLPARATVAGWVILLPLGRLTKGGVLGNGRDVAIDATMMNYN